MSHCIAGFGSPSSYKYIMFVNGHCWSSNALPVMSVLACAPAVPKLHCGTVWKVSCITVDYAPMLPRCICKFSQQGTQAKGFISLNYEV